MTRRSLRRTDGEGALFGLARGLLPFLVGQLLIFVVVAGHTGAVLVVNGLSILLLSR